MISDRDLRRRYGADALITRKGRFALVHLDQPGARLIRERLRDFEPDEYFEDGCPLCEVQRAAGVYVFEAFPGEDEEIFIL